MKEPELTLEAKSAIIKYMITIVALPMFLFSALSFIIGFLVKDVAQSRAYNDAYREAASDIRKLTDSLYETKSDVKFTKEETDKAKNRIEKADKEIRTIRNQILSYEKEAEKIRNTLKTAKSFQQSESIVTSLTEALITRDDFIEKIIEGSDKKYQSLKLKINNLKNKIHFLENDLKVDFGYTTLEKDQKNIFIHHKLGHKPNFIKIYVFPYNSIRFCHSVWISGGNIDSVALIKHRDNNGKIHTHIKRDTLEILTDEISDGVAQNFAIYIIDNKKISIKRGKSWGKYSRTNINIQWYLY